MSGCYFVSHIVRTQINRRIPLANELRNTRNRNRLGGMDWALVKNLFGKGNQSLVRLSKSEGQNRLLSMVQIKHTLKK